MHNQQIVTISFFRYEGLSNKWWAFRQMGLSANELSQIPGLEFAKMLGSGGQRGFSIWPNFGVYGLLCCWSSESQAQDFFNQHPLYADYSEHSTEQWTVFMHNTMAHGEWEGKNPFRKSAPIDEDALVGVLTRATIKTRYLPQFWRFVPPVSASVHEKKGRLFSIGVGELPIVQQATFSFWESSRLMKAYAYKSKFHKEVVQKTRELGWYKEELFARFAPYKSHGSWNGNAILAPYLKASV